MKWCFVLGLLALAVVESAVGQAFASAAAPGSAQDALQRAYDADARGDKATALAEYQAVTASGDSALYDQACMGVVYDAPLLRHRLPDPWYLAFYANPLFMQRRYAPPTATQRDFDDAIVQSQLRIGRFWDERKKFSIYGYAGLDKDSSSHGGLLPQILNDNHLALGGGVDYRPFEGLRLFAQGGPDYDLTDQNRSRLRADAQIGAVYYGAWGAQNRCRDHGTWSWRRFADLNAEAIQYTRYQNLIAGLNGRAGLRAYQYRYTNVSIYVLGNLLLDRKDLFYNNAIEFGPGLEWIPDLKLPINLRFEYRFGHYLRGLPPGTSSDYRTLLLQAVIYVEQ